MVTRDTPWPEGTPCWVDLSITDIPKAIAFYQGLFGWDTQQGPPEAGGYAISHLDGRSVAGIGPKMGSPEAPSVWMTYIATDDADATAAKIKGAGGQLMMDPMDVMDVGRMLVAADTDASVAKATQLGGHIIRPASDSPYGRMATVSDSEGAMFSLISISAGD